MIDAGAVQALQTLRSVATHRTLTRAAEELGLTASAVSHQIKRLERQIGVPLLAPAGRGVVLTPAGQAIVDSAPEVFHALERCVEAGRSVAQGSPRGIIRVVGFSTAICGLLAPAIPPLATHYPDLCVLISQQEPDQAPHTVDAGTADLALTHDVDGRPTPAPPSLIRRRIHTDLGDVVMHRTHPLAGVGSPLAACDLAGHAWVTTPPGTVRHEWFRSLFTGVPEHPEVRHVVDGLAAQLSLVASGEVIALVPRLGRLPLGDGLIARSLQRPPKREVYAIWRRSADANPAIQAVFAELARIGKSGV